MRMRILFLTLCSYNSVQNRDIYMDLLRVFMKNGHEVYIVSPAERRTGIQTGMIQEGNCHILRVRTGNIQKTNVIEKGISTVLLEAQFQKAIRKYFPDKSFDLCLYSTPPITIAGVVEFVKRRDHAKTYLMLKDIFPQNAVDIGMMRKQGISGLLYRYFRKKEKKLYALSDRIGCMSQANVDCVLKHNPEIPADRVEICPNSIEVQDCSVSSENRKAMRLKYEIPLEAIVFVYGGNLGRPQGIDFLIQCLKSQKDNPDVFFLIVGDGTEFGKLDAFMKNEKQKNVKLMSRLPKEDYDQMVGSCDVGMLFLDYRFTIPNFPSRLLSYMQAGMPVLAVTDPNTDVGKVIEDGNFGWWCESSQIPAFQKQIRQICRMQKEVRQQMGENGYHVLVSQYNVDRVCVQIENWAMEA